MCLESLHKTSYSSLKISVVSNGSCNSVNSKLLAMQQQELIDELIIETARHQYTQDYINLTKDFYLKM